MKQDGGLKTKAFEMVCINIKRTFKQCELYTDLAWCQLKYKEVGCLIDFCDHNNALARA